MATALGSMGRRIALVAVAGRSGTLRTPSVVSRVTRRLQSTDATAAPGQAAASQPEPDTPTEAPKKARLGFFRGTLGLILLATATYYGTAVYQGLQSPRGPKRPVEAPKGPSTNVGADKEPAMPRGAPLEARKQAKEAPLPAPAASAAPATIEDSRHQPTRSLGASPTGSETTVTKAPPADSNARTIPLPSPEPETPPPPMDADVQDTSIAQALTHAREAAATALAAAVEKRLAVFDDLPPLQALTLHIEALKDQLENRDDGLPKEVLLSYVKRLADKVDAIESAEMSTLKEALEDQAEAFASVMEQGTSDGQKALEEQRLRLEAEARERLSTLETKLQEAEEATAKYADLAVAVTRSVEALKREAEQNAKELETYFQSLAKEALDRERNERLAIIRDLSMKLELLEKHRMENVDGARKIAELQKLQGAVTAFGIALRDRTGEPFQEEVELLARVGNGNPVVTSCVDMVRDDAPAGILSDFELERWFIQGVKGAASRAGRMESADGVAGYVLAALPALPAVLGGGSKRTETDIALERAERLLREGNIEGAAREVNQLQGWAKVAAQDWLEAARRKVRANYALDLLQAELTMMLSELQ